MHDFAETLRLINGKKILIANRGIPGPQGVPLHPGTSRRNRRNDRYRR